MSELRVLFLHRSLGRGGAERQIIALTAGLAKRGHQVSMALFYREGGLIEDLPMEGVQVYDLRKSGRYDAIGFSRRLMAVLEEAKPDVLCSFLPASNIVAATCKLVRPALRVVLGIRAAHMNLKQYDFLSGMTYRVEPYLARMANLIVSNSEAGKEDASCRKFPMERVTVVYNGIDTDRFRPDSQAGLALRSEWRISEGATVIGLVGRLDPMKDHVTFLRAAALLVKTRPSMRFLCVGDGAAEFLSSLRGYAEALGLSETVAFESGTRDVVAVYNCCDIICSTSAFGEGFSNVLAEAMSCGRRCVATDVGDSSLILGDIGRIVPPRNPAAVASSISELCGLNEGILPTCQSARDRIVKMFSVDRMVTRFEQLFESTANRALP